MPAGTNTKIKNDLFSIKFREFRRMGPLITIILVLLCGCLLPVLFYRYDNKYTRPRPFASSGTIPLNMEWYQKNPFFYLIEGWDFYQDSLLTPDELSNHSADRTLYIGQFGGFDLGDPDADPHGCGTYRIVILTDSTEREYALELTQIYSSWDLWVNGRLVQSIGMGRENPPSPDSRMVTFRAKDRIEIVAAVSDNNHFYSGMVYPPAFGSAEKVGHVLSLRLFIHGGFCAVALLLAFLCLFWGYGCHFIRPYGALALLCFACCGSTSWPVVQALGLSGEFWPLLERLCYYGIFLTVIWLQGRMCHLPEKFIWPACVLGIIVEFSLLIQPLVPVHQAIWYIRYSSMLAAYKWITAMWLIATGIWALCRKRDYAGPMMAASCILALSLIMSKILPMHEPVLFGWFVEIAAGILIFLITGFLWLDTVNLYKESMQLKIGRELAAVQLKARDEQAALQQEYVRLTREQLHESRHRLTLIRHYLDTGELEQLSGYIGQLTSDMSGRESREYTGNSLIDALLTSQLHKADKLGIYVELDLDNLPGRISISDDDITVCLLNLLDNALESCMKMPEEERWISLRISLETEIIRIRCSNAALPPTEEKEKTSKEDKKAHGFGLARIREIAEKYGGCVEIERETDSYHVTLDLLLSSRPSDLNFC